MLWLGTKILPIVAIGIAIILGGFIILSFSGNIKNTGDRLDANSGDAGIDIKEVNNFEECVSAGYSVMESYPRQCRDGAGNLYVEITTAQSSESEQESSVNKAPLESSASLSEKQKQMSEQNFSQSQLLQQGARFIPKSEKCPDGIWDAAEQADPSLCPEDNPNLIRDSIPFVSDTGSINPFQSPTTSYDYIRHNIDIVYKINTASRPAWVPSEPIPGAGGKLAIHPYDSSVYIATSRDGFTFTNKKLFVHHAGVPHIILTNDNRLVATFQYFSPTDLTIYDVITYTTSDDFGVTWSPVNRFYVKDLCPAERNKCNDPVLLQLSDGSFRLYFSHNGPQESGFWMYSAINKVLDTPFISEGPQVDASDVSDPAVVFYKNQWHYFANKGDSTLAGKFIGVRAVSDTGKKFSRVNSAITLELPFLGDVIEDNGKLRFFAGSKSANSYDGDNWVMESGIRVEEGADPGVVKLPDGSYIMLYVSGGP